MNTAPPARTATEHLLPFDRLSPEVFEQLCLWLVEREGYERAEHVGASGSDRGCDILAWRSGELWAFQCKRTLSFGPTDAEQEVDKVLAARKAGAGPVGLTFIVTCRVSAETRERGRARCAGQMRAEFWACTELDMRVRGHPDIVRRFFCAFTPHALALQAGLALDDHPIPHSFVLTHEGTCVFHLLDERFRQQQRGGEPADFYDGTHPNWVNIAQSHDARRNLYAAVRDFVEDAALPAQRVAVILGLAGEGKTTLLRRLAWDLAEAGWPVLWRHTGLAGLTSRLDLHKRLPLPIVLCIDQADDEPMLPALVEELHHSAIPCVILAASRLHEWKAAELSARLMHYARVQSFYLGAIERDEVLDLLNRLAAAGKLGALAALSMDAQIALFLDRLEADGQLLPAMLTARYGAPSFDAIVEDVLLKIRRRPDGERLLRAYTLLAAVHRYGYWLSTSILASALGLAEADIKVQVVQPLDGELLQVTRVDQDRLYTRHPLIADRVFRISLGKGWIDERSHYVTIVNTLAAALEHTDLASYERRLLMSLALRLEGEDVNLLNTVLNRLARQPVDSTVFWEAWGLVARTAGRHEKAREFFERATGLDASRAPAWQAWACMEGRLGNCAEARRLYQRGIEADRHFAPLWQAWAIMEKDQCEIEKARWLFQCGTEIAPAHGPLWQAWAILEKEQGNIEEARQLFRIGSEVDPAHAPTWQAWAILEKEQGNIEEARRLFKRGSEADPTHAPSWQAWAILEKEQGEIDNARRLFRRGTQADATHAASWHAWGLLESEQGNVKGARRLFERGSAANPSHVPTLVAWALLEKGQGDVDEARRLFRRATEADSTGARSWRAWAYLEMEDGNVEEAHRLFKRALEADPSHAPTWHKLGLLEKDKGAIGEARRHFARATQADAAYAPSWRAWAYLEKKQGQIEDARHFFRRATELEPAHAATWYAWAEMEEAHGYPEEAECLRLQGRIASYTTNSTFCLGCVRRYEQLGLYEMARRFLQLGTQATPSNSRLWFTWVRLEKKLGDDEGAFRVLQKGRLSSPDVVHLHVEGAMLGKALGHLDEACQACRQGLLLQPANRHLWRIWTEIQVETANHTAFHELLRQAIEYAMQGEVMETLQRLAEESEVAKTMQQEAHAMLKSHSHDGLPEELDRGSDLV